MESGAEESPVTIVNDKIVAELVDSMMNSVNKKKEKLQQLLDCSLVVMQPHFHKLL